MYETALCALCASRASLALQPGTTGQPEKPPITRSRPGSGSAARRRRSRPRPRMDSAAAAAAWRLDRQHPLPRRIVCECRRHPGPRTPVAQQGTRRASCAVPCALAWCVVRGAWCVVRGAWGMARGAWRVVREAWRVERGACVYRRTVQSLTRGDQLLPKYVPSTCYRVLRRPTLAIFLNFSEATSLLSGFLSGCHFIASLWYAFLISRAEEDRTTPSTCRRSKQARQ